MLICRKCHDKAVKLGMLEAVKKLIKNGWWICPHFKSKCGKVSA